MPDSSQPGDAQAERPERSAKIEELLLSGLDYYFAGEHDRAISVWTRVLFLDRGHARARAYIERARGALAERQRESEELVQRGAAAFEAGRTADARELLSAAVARGGPHDVAIALLDRLDRLEAFPQADGGRAASRAHRKQPKGDSKRLTVVAWVLVGLSAVAVAIALLYLAASSIELIGMPQPTVAGRAQPSSLPADTLPLPRSADLALARARANAAAGHLKDALVELERIRPGDPAHPEAQRLKADIQSSLLAGLPPLGSADVRTTK